MHCVETVKLLIGAAGRDLENDSDIAGATGARNAIKVSVPSLRHDRRMLRTASSRVRWKVVQIGVPLSAKKLSAQQHGK